MRTFILRPDQGEDQPSDRSQGASPQRHDADYEHRERAGGAAAVAGAAFATASGESVSAAAAVGGVAAGTKIIRDPGARFRSLQQHNAANGGDDQKDPEGSHFTKAGVLEFECFTLRPY